MTSMDELYRELMRDMHFIEKLIIAGYIDKEKGGTLINGIADKIEVIMERW